MKSQSDNLIHIVAGICEDVRRAYPTLARGLSRDLKRLSLLVESRGLGVFTLDLPARESALVAALKSGSLVREGSLRYSKRYPVPRLFAGLYMLIFDKRLCLRSDADVNAIMFLRQLLVIGKKIEKPCSQKREQMAIEEYIHVEQQMVGPSLDWESDCLDRRGIGTSLHLCDGLDPDLPLYPEYNLGRTAGDRLLLQRCQRLADIIFGEIGPFCPECFIEARRSDGRRLGFRHGPGAVAERGGRFFDKFRFSNWPNKLQSLYPWETTGKLPNDERPRPRNHEVPARLITVPKTQKGPRIIAAEPSEHMYTQNLLADWLIEKVDTTLLGKFVNFKDQGKSGKLVLKSSLDQSLATIDLSSASDRLSLWVVERMFRKNPSILKAIHATRTRWLRLPDGSCIKLKKFASQGTALTFPVQTLVFLVIALSASADRVTTMDDLRRLIGKVRVYGDDIIVPVDGYAKTVDLLHMLGLKVNEDKSFATGYFRESCGTDAYKGYDITPVKPKTTVSDNPESCQAVLDTINNLFCKGYFYASRTLEHRQPARIRYGYGLVGRDSGATGYLSFSFGTTLRSKFEDELVQCDRLRRLPDLLQRKEQHVQSLDAGSVRRFLSTILPFRTRWNVKLHHNEVRLACLSSRARKRDYDCGYSGVLERQLRPSPIEQGSFSVSVSGVPVRPSCRIGMRWVRVQDLF